MRASLALIGLLGIVFGIIWLPIACIVVLALRFRSWEALVLGLAIDLIWMPVHGGLSVPIFTAGAVFIVWALEPLRLELLS